MINEMFCLFFRYILEAINRVSHNYESIKEAFPTSATASITVPLPVISSETESVRKAADSDNDDEFNANAVEDLGLTDRLTLTSPSDVIVSETVVMEDAEVIVSPMELMRRLDEQVSLSSLLDRLMDCSNDWVIDWFIDSLIHSTVFFRLIKLFWKEA